MRNIIEKAMNKITLSVLIIFSIAVLQIVSHDNNLYAAEVFTWVDSNGVTHYSDKPFKAAKKISFSVPTPKQKTKETIIEGSESTVSEGEDSVSAECASTKTRIANLLKGGKIIYKDAKGNDAELSTDQINAKLAENQSYVKRYCTKELPSKDSSTDDG